jgi:hypothetical protein
MRPADRGTHPPTITNNEICPKRKAGHEVPGPISLQSEMTSLRLAVIWLAVFRLAVRMPRIVVLNRSRML